MGCYGRQLRRQGASSEQDHINEYQTEEMDKDKVAGWSLQELHHSCVDFDELGGV